MVCLCLGESLDFLNIKLNLYLLFVLNIFRYVIVVMVCFDVFEYIWSFVLMVLLKGIEVNIFGILSKDRLFVLFFYCFLIFV